ncbi:uncharacterized protein LOC115211591 isoform X1 [Argonauta hians]
MKLQLRIILLLLIISYSKGNDDAKYVYGTVSNPLTLTCDFAGSTVEWVNFKDNKYLFSYMDCVIYHKNDELTKDLSSNCSISISMKRSYLTFHNLTQKHDQMKILCLRKKRMNIVFTIKISKLPTVKISSVITKIGLSTTLKCNLEGIEDFQMVSLKWIQTLFGQQIEGHVSNSSELIFQNVSWRDTGNWTCIVRIQRNGKIESIEGTGTLSAFGVPLVEHFKNSIESEENQSKTMRSFIYSYSKPFKVTWYRNSKAIVVRPLLQSSIHQVLVANHTIGLPGFVSQLVLEDINKKDAGKYTLSVRNPMGEFNATFILKIKVRAQTMNVTLIAGITCAVIFILSIFIIICVCYISIRKNLSASKEEPDIRCIPLSEISQQTSSSSLGHSCNEKVFSKNKSPCKKYHKDSQRDKLCPGTDDPVYEEIGYTVMNKPRTLRSTQNEYLCPVSISSQTYKK